MFEKTLNITVRPFLTLADAKNKWIIRDASTVINVSAKFDFDVAKYLTSVSVNYYWFPMTEQSGYMGLHSIFAALSILRDVVARKETAIIHCFGGNNRSQLVYECLFYMTNHKWIEHEYQGYQSVIDYNCANKFLPCKESMEHFLNGIKAGKELEDLMNDLKIPCTSK